jgi:hypothetical protein
MNFNKSLLFVLCLSLTEFAYTRQIDSCIAIDAGMYNPSIPCLEKVNCLVYNGSFSEIDEPNSYPNIKFIVYFGNDWDYTNTILPQSWLQLKNLKGILLMNMTFEDSAMKQIESVRKGLFLGNLWACHAEWKDLTPNNDPCYLRQLSFCTNARIPYSLELENIAWKASLSHADSLYLLDYCTNPNGPMYYYSSENKGKIRQACNKWLHLDNWIKSPPERLIDTLLLNKNRTMETKMDLFRYLDTSGQIVHLNIIVRTLLQSDLDELTKYGEGYDYTQYHWFQEDVSNKLEYFDEFINKGIFDADTLKLYAAVEKKTRS